MRVSSALLFLALASPAAAQPTPDVHVPPIEFAAGVSIERSTAGAVASIAGNLTKMLSIVSEADASADGAALLAGARVGTGFYYDGKPPIPGRFFSQILAGRQHGPTATAATIVQPGVGGDVIVLPRSHLSLHWAVDYRWIASAAPERSGARLVVGILIGPGT